MLLEFYKKARLKRLIVSICNDVLDSNDRLDEIPFEYLFLRVMNRLTVICKLTEGKDFTEKEVKETIQDYTWELSQNSK